MKKFCVLLLVLFVIYPAFAQDYFILGKQAFAKKDYPTAEKLFLKALSVSQNNWACRYFLATTYVKENEIAKAKQEYTKIIAYAPTTKEGELARESLVNLNKAGNSNSTTKITMSDNYFDNIKFEGRYVKWNPPLISVYVEPSEYQLLTKQAFLTWQKASEDLIKFYFTEDAKKALIKVSMTTGLNTYEDGEEAGISKSTVLGDDIIASEIFLLSKDPKTGMNLSDNIVFSTALHEIGHSLGIQGHSPNDNDIMSAKNTVGLKTLAKRDLTTLKMLYKKS